MDALMADFEKDMRENDYGDLLVRSFASAQMPIDDDSVSLLVAAITCSRFSRECRANWSSLPPPLPPRCRRIVARGGGDARWGGLRRQFDVFSRSVVGVWVAVPWHGVPRWEMWCPVRLSVSIEHFRCLVGFPCDCVGTCTSSNRGVSTKRLRMFAHGRGMKGLWPERGSLL